MNPQHLSDEAVAAFADGVLVGRARERAAKHTTACPECAQAVKAQREAAWALRAAPAPCLPSGLLDRLRCVPQTTPITPPPTVIAPDGSTMLATFAPVAALVASAPQPRTAHRTRTIITTAAIVALAGALTAGSVAKSEDPPVHTGHAGDVRISTPDPSGSAPVVPGVNVFRSDPH